MFVFKWITRNIRYIRAVNSCDAKEFQGFISSLIDEVGCTTEAVLKLFTSKLYLWNIIRGKGFYKAMVPYIVSEVNSGNIAIAECVLSAVAITTKQSSDPIRNNPIMYLVRHIMKAAPFLSFTTIKYSSKARIEEILDSPEKLKNIYVCEELLPFVKRIVELDEMADLVEALGAMDSI